MSNPVVALHKLVVVEEERHIPVEVGHRIQVEELRSPAAAERHSPVVGRRNQAAVEPHTQAGEEPHIPAEEGLHIQAAVGPRIHLGLEDNRHPEPEDIPDPLGPAGKRKWHWRQRLQNQCRRRRQPRDSQAAVDILKQKVVYSSKQRKWERNSRDRPCIIFEEIPGCGIPPAGGYPGCGG